MRQTKSIWYTIWILIGFVVLAVVDRVPDPPSANPHSAKSCVSSPHELPAAFDTASQFLVCAFGQSEASTAFVPYEFVLPANRTDPLERATDPSPPILHS